ncbi:acetyltransferase [Jiangella aurantiaca]|uniref:Acetyltransferase n=1 Tax=Jiangella aurantiaca TaxID=2530373 RepID=A0A4R5AIX6_9ACTN|nr:acetyltransferase [Jiangella aurantiaca]TDD70934.1 acetyltransferase [Jiangella aurantiaca]
MSRALVLVAAGGLAREALAAIRAGAAPGHEVAGLLDDDLRKAGTSVDGVPVLGTLDDVTEHADADVVICSGRGGARRDIAARFAKLGVDARRYVSIVHPATPVPAGCVVGAGSILLAGVVLTAAVTVGRHVVCMPHVTLTHDDVVGDYATLAAGVALGGGVVVGEAAYLGMNSSVREQRRVGDDAVLGMGAALVEDQPARTTWAGVPARPLTRREEPK